MVQQICLPSLISPFPSLQSVINPHTLKYPNCQKAHKSLCIPISAPGISVGGGGKKNKKQKKKKKKKKNKKKQTQKKKTKTLNSQIEKK